MNEHLKERLEVLRAQVRGIYGNPLIPLAVKEAVGTTLEILEVLAKEVAHGRAA